ncbi:fumarylacetoacetate hydrolase family protein [Paraburkholderia sediminicola]|uniref:fumarylacetoacetate hydrolase family protein n=1 Tax=Paraburkholderia sediminicola TaxID=458836 RepID=UPI0038BA4045
MKLVTIKSESEQLVGVVLDDKVLPLKRLAKAAGVYLPSSMQELIEEGQRVVPLLRKLIGRINEYSLEYIPLEQANVLAPIPRPRNSIFGVGMNYKAHVDEAHTSMGTSKALPAAPVYFTKPSLAVVGPGQAILNHSGVTGQLDWEAELAVIIGRGGKGISQEVALDHVFGYTCLNDISARDCRREHQWFLAKSLDGSAPMGPCIVTADEISDPQDLFVTLSVNGVQRQADRTERMIFSVAGIIADLSRAVTLEPGDIIATGTPSGVGISFTPPVFLNNGDVVSMEISRIGVLTNPVEEA